MRIDGSTIGRQGKSKLTRSPPKQRSGWRVCFHRNGSGDRAEHCRMRQCSNDGTTKESNERKGENGKRMNRKSKKKKNSKKNKKNVKKNKHKKGGTSFAK